jgi:hypothetical protein
MIQAYRRRRQRGLRTAFGGVALPISLALTSVLACATPASAQTTVGQCTGPMWFLGFDSQVCVVADTRWKNTSDHTEWVGLVSVNHGLPNSKLEIWGDGFYHVGYGEKQSWWIDRRVRSGTNICGAITDLHGNRVIACIGIRV